MMRVYILIQIIIVNPRHQIKWKCVIKINQLRNGFFIQNILSINENNNKKKQKHKAKQLKFNYK